LPLQVLEIVGAIGVAAKELVVGDGRRRPIFHRPAPPAPALAGGRGNVLVQFECRPAVMLKIAKGAAARARTRAELAFAEMLIQQREYLELQSGDRGV